MKSVKQVYEDISYFVNVWEVIITITVLAFILIVSLPTIQGILYKVLVGSPGFVQWTIVASLIGVIGVYKKSPAILGFSVVVFVVLGVITGPVAGGVYANTHMADQMQTNADELDTLPNTSVENVRVVPRSVSDNYAESSMQYPKYRLTESDITYRDGTYTWSHGIVPDNIMVSWLGNQNGAMYVDMTTTDKQVRTEETSFKNGRGQIVTDSFKYRSVLHAPLKQHNWGTTFNAEVNGTSYIAHSTTTYEWKFRLTPIPQFYAIPTHGSVEMMYPDGDVESLSPNEAQQEPLLRGQNYYPYHIAMFKVESMKYVNGALNEWFWKEGVLEVAELPENGNEWPIVVPVEENNPSLTYFVATEPTGSGTGVYEVWTIDGQTGETGFQAYDDAQLGPRKAVDFVERRSEVNRLSNAEAIAPVPIVKNDHLYWHVKVVPSKRTGLIYTAFVNAESGDVTLVEGTEPIYAFMTEEEISDVKNETEGTGEDLMTVTVVVTDSDGEITGTQNITVPEGGGVEVQVSDPRNESQNTTTTP